MTSSEDERLASEVLIRLLNNTEAERYRLAVELERVMNERDLAVLTMAAFTPASAGAEVQRLRAALNAIGALGGPLHMLQPDQGQRPDYAGAATELRRILTTVDTTEGDD